MDMQNFNPPIGQPEPVGPDLRRILAPNPSPMTFRGTNTYLLGHRQIAVIDPGPDDMAHLDAIMEALTPEQSISHIFVTHSHMDHSPLARPLSDRTGAPILAYGSSGSGRSAIMTELAAQGLESSGEGIDHHFAPDICLTDGEKVEAEDWALTALWTPGHLGNHLCFQTGRTVFTGDLVMGWASSLVSPPDGDLTDFMDSCRRLRGIEADIFHSGHGAPILAPMERLNWLISHRQSREAAILDALSHHPATPQSLTEQIYTDTPQALLPAACRNIMAHLIDLYGRKVVSPDSKLSRNAIFKLISPIT